LWSYNTCKNSTTNVNVSKKKLDYEFCCNKKRNASEKLGGDFTLLKSVLAQDKFVSQKEGSSIEGEMPKLGLSKETFIQNKLKD